MEVKSMKEVDANIDIWNYVFGFTPMAVVKCAIELRIPDVLKGHGGAMSLIDLSSALACSPSALHRIMRYLSHRGFFKQIYSNSTTNDQQLSSISYANTPLSLLLLQNDKSSLAPLLLLESNHVMLASWHKLSSRASVNGGSAFEAANGEDVWQYALKNPTHSKLINDAMACHAGRAVRQILNRYPQVFEGIGSLVDVGGGDGTALGCIVKACPRIRGINFDLSHVVSVAPRREGVEHVSGDMFQKVPKADAAFIMWVLHDWGDEECVQILMKCREAIPEKTGKVIIAEAVIVEGQDNKYDDVRLALDMVMMAHTEKGKERTIQEWECVIKGAGFSSFNIRSIDSILSIIEAYP